ncbi:O-antigen polymerase [Xylanibacter caecicola]|uniref:O-antigen polymerase n=1 Tax=Xylanibacter caecicola TaxID=2736294 RepID=UPI0025885726|nr:O-antigen polymerase [Xylanibacter caecicola]
MYTLNYDNILTCAYILMWGVTLVWYQYRRNVWDSGSILILLNQFYSVFALVTLNDDVLPFSYKPLEVFPYIYLYSMLMLALMPMIRQHLVPSDKIEEPQTRALAIAAIVIIASSVMIVPDMMGNFETGLVKLFTDADAGKDAYMEQTKEQADSGSGISNIASVMYNSMQDIAVFLFFYFLTLRGRRRWMTVALGFSFVISFLSPIMNGQRTGTINSLLLAAGSYMLFKQYLPALVNKAVRIVGTVMIVLIMLPVAAVTVSRFDGRGGGGVASFLYWYIGQAPLYFNNHCLDAGGTRNGERILNLFIRAVNPDTPKNFVERRDKYHNLEIDDHLFTTFVGDFCIDFGPIAATVIFIVFYTWATRQIRPRDGTIKMHQLFLVFFTMAVYIQGNMYLFSYADTGNIRLITMALFYSYLRYHEKLLERFPLTIEEEQDTDNNIKTT